MKAKTAFSMLTALVLTICPPAQAAEQGEKLRRDLMAKIHKAVDDRDEVAEKNLKAALAKLEASIGKPRKKPDKLSKVGETHIKRLIDGGFHLQQTPNQDNPAKFAFSRDLQAGTKTVYTADFFLSWTMPDSLADKWKWRQDAWDLNLGASVQGKLTSEKATDVDAWRFRTTLSGRYTFNPTSQDLNKMFGLVWDLSAKDEANRDFKYNRVGAEFTVATVAPALAMGIYKPSPGQDHLPPIQFRWQPTLGLDAGATTNNSARLANGSNDTLWLTAHGLAKIRLNFISQALKLEEVSLYADDKITYLSDAGTAHNYLKTGLNIMFSKNFGISLDYSLGEDSPQFKKEESFNGAFTIQF